MNITLLASPPFPCHGMCSQLKMVNGMIFSSKKSFLCGIIVLRGNDNLIVGGFNCGAKIVMTDHEIAADKLLPVHPGEVLAEEFLKLYS